MKIRDGCGHPGFPHTARGTRIFTAGKRWSGQLAHDALKQLTRAIRHVWPVLRYRLRWDTSTQVLLGRVLFLVGLVMQLVLVLLLWVAVDLLLDVMTLWVELAAKHLRIVLDPT